jgi:hypothetical protein
MNMAATSVWRKSSSCTNLQCVEVATRYGATILRNSTDCQQVLRVPQGGFQKLLNFVKS